tara:strand:- start:528 stop:1244 length:717 start_codon:yes stop_codon:yes gene_type:complete
MKKLLTILFILPFCLNAQEKNNFDGIIKQKIIKNLTRTVFYPNNPFEKAFHIVSITCQNLDTKELFELTQRSEKELTALRFGKYKFNLEYKFNIEDFKDVAVGSNQNSISPEKEKIIIEKINNNLLELSSISIKIRTARSYINSPLFNQGGNYYLINDGNYIQFSPRFSFPDDDSQIEKNYLKFDYSDPFEFQYIYEGFAYTFRRFLKKPQPALSFFFDIENYHELVRPTFAEFYVQN